VKRARFIYAMILAVIYITATSMSSIAILSCDHHHHHHHHHPHSECHSTSCPCHSDIVAIGEDCCDHHHPILGDHHTDFFVSNERNDLRTTIALSLITVPALMGEYTCDAYSEALSLAPLIYGDEVPPLRVAIYSAEALRAPPVLA
jgi:hypothetical protein